MNTMKSMSIMCAAKSLDEDEMYRFVRGEFRDCPYYQFGDEYQIVKKQI